RRADDAVDVLLGRQRHRPDHARPGARDRLHDLARTRVDGLVVVGLQPDADLLSRHGGSPFLRIVSAGQRLALRSTRSGVSRLWDTDRGTTVVVAGGLVARAADAAAQWLADQPQSLGRYSRRSGRFAQSAAPTSSNPSSVAQAISRPHTGGRFGLASTVKPAPSALRRSPPSANASEHGCRSRQR